MKKLFRFFTAAFACITLLTCSACGVPSDNTATGYDDDLLEYSGVYDNKGLFDDDELEELNDLVRETSEKTELHIIIYLSDVPRSESFTAEFSDDFYNAVFGKDSDGVIYYMDLSEQTYAYDFISTSGKGVLLYESHIDRMFDHIYAFLPASGEPIYASEISTAIKEICDIFERYGNDEPSAVDFSYDEYTGKYIYYKNGETIVSAHKPLGLSILSSWKYGLIGIIVGFICYFSVKKHYKFKPSCNPGVYVSGNETRFNRREDIFIRTYTTKTKIESSSSGGGGRSGRSGHGRSGGSHGGGGRRR